MPTTEQQQMQIRSILWFAFATTIAIYNFIVFLVTGSATATPRITRELSFHDPMVVSLCIVGALAFAGSLFLARTPLSSSAQDYPKFIVRMAVSEIPAILGLMLAFTTHRPEPLWAASAVSVVLLVLHRPFRSQTI